MNKMRQKLPVFIFLQHTEVSFWMKQQQFYVSVEGEPIATTGGWN